MFSKYSDDELIHELALTRNNISKFSNLQMAAKILLNAGYGATTSPYFRYFKNEVAEGITLTGQLVVKWAEKSFNKYLSEIMKDDIERVVYVDTDSNYLVMDDFVKKYMKGKTKEEIVDMLDRFGEEKLFPFITDRYNKLGEYLNSFQQLYIMEREAIADVAVWTAKKRYFMSVLDNEGVRYKEPSIKMLGIDAIKSSTPSACRSKLKETIKIILYKENDELIEFVKTFRTEFEKLPLDQISFPSGVNGMEKYADKQSIYGKRTPIHVRGSLLHNKYTKTTDKILDGDKIKYLYLTLPNPINENVISYIEYLPEELNLHEYVDYDTMFQKAFIKPLTGQIEAMGWTTDKISNLGDWF